MAKITFILGLCGSGKTFFAEKMKEQQPDLYLIDEGFNPVFNADQFNTNYQNVKNNLSNGKDCVIIEMAFSIEDARKFIMELIAQDFQGVKIEWKCFENNIEKANKNLLNKTRQKGDIEGHKKINANISPVYTYPEDAEILSIYQSK